MSPSRALATVEYRPLRGPIQRQLVHQRIECECRRCRAIEDGFHEIWGEAGER